MRNYKLLGGSAMALAVVIAAFGVQAGFSAAPSAPSSVVTIDPARILDTRIALGVPGTTPVGPASTITVQVTGVGGVPANATGVVVTLTGTEATQATFVTATPSGSPRSTTSVLNITPGTDIANTVTMSIGTGGKIDLYNNGGSVHLVADVTGYLLPEAGGTTTTPPGPTVETHTFEMGTYSGHLANANATFQPVNGCVTLNNGGEIFLDVPLPDGAAISKVDFRFNDTSIGGFLTFLLFEVDQFTPQTAPNTAGTLLNSQVQSPSAAVNWDTVTMTPGGADKAGPGVRYTIDAFSNANGLIFCGVSVEYKIVTA